MFKGGFNSGYFIGHRFKVQAVTLPNGLFGNVCIALLRISDCGLQNMSGLNAYLSSHFREFDMQIWVAKKQYPAVYGDSVFPQLTTIVARYNNGMLD